MEARASTGSNSTQYCILEVLATVIEQEKLRIQIGKKEVGLSLFADDIIHLEDLSSPKKFLKTISQDTGHKVNTQKLIAFSYTKNRNKQLLNGIDHAIYVTKYIHPKMWGNLFHENLNYYPTKAII